jgi:hypothetical protein
MISGFHIKIDGCVGQSFIRSYAILTQSTNLSDAILAYCGVTKTVYIPESLRSSPPCLDPRVASLQPAVSRSRVTGSA